MFGMQILKNWWETHSILRDQGLARRQRRLLRDYASKIEKDLATLKKLDESIEDGNRDSISIALEHYKVLFEKEFNDLQDVIVEFKTLVHRNIEKLERLRQDVSANKNDLSKSEHIKEINTIESGLVDAIGQEMQNLTSFSNTNFSLRALVNRASLIQDARYNANQARKDVKKLNRDIRKVDKQARKGEDIKEDSLKDAITQAKSELEHELKVLKDCFQLLQDMSNDLQEKMKFIEKEAAKPAPLTYPWPEDKEFLFNLQGEIDRWIIEETRLGRIWLTEAERLKAEINTSR
jgi:hypothetical protein